MGLRHRLARVEAALPDHLSEAVAELVAATGISAQMARLILVEVEKCYHPDRGTMLAAVAEKFRMDPATLRREVEDLEQP